MKSSTTGNFSMKQSSARPAGKLNVATNYRHNPRGRILDLDDDILLPADPRPVMRQPAPVSAPPVERSAAAAKPASNESSQANAGLRPPQIQTSSSDGNAAKSEPHRFKELLSEASDRITSLEKTIEEQAKALSLYQNQILDLTNKGDQQAGDLQSACRVVGVLEQAVTTLREAASKRDSELAAANEKLNLSDQIRLALQAQLNAAHKDHMQVSNKLLAAETALNDQNAVTAAAWETIDRANAELEQLRTQNAAIETELKATKQQQSRDLDEQQANFQREIEVIKAHSQQSARQAETMAMDRAVLQRRCEDLVRTVGLLQAAHRKMSSELQGNVCDLGHLHTELSEMRASQASMASKFEQAETRLGKMRQHVEELEKSSTILARHDAALVEAAVKNESDLEQETQRLLKPFDEPGADIIKLETATRGKKVA